MIAENYYENRGITLKYYEIKNDLQPLVLLHAQGVDGLSFAKVMTQLSEKYHVYSIDCYGHGASLHDALQYNIIDISNAVIAFVEDIVKDKIFLLGHSSGGLIAAYIAAKTQLCRCLILEDPPFFSCQGERRKLSYNYIDLSTVCHNFINQTQCNDFVLYYFCNQYAWKFFPEKSREKIHKKMVKMAAKYRSKHPNENLKVMFWPKAALSGYQGMNNYDPLFGEAFFDDSFHAGIPHEDILKDIKCKTIFMKAKTNTGDGEVLMAALSEDDLKKVCSLIDDCDVVFFDCGHGIHIEKQKEFLDCVLNIERQL